MSAPYEQDSRIDQPGASDDSLQEVHATLLREKPEPGEGTVPVPLLLLALIGGLVFFSGVYLGRYSGGFDPMVYNEEAQAGGGGAAGATAAADPVAVGKRLFVQNCVTCHQAAGQGLPGVYPPLAGSDWVNGSEEALVRCSPSCARNGATRADPSRPSRWRRFALPRPVATRLGRPPSSRNSTSRNRKREPVSLRRLSVAGRIGTTGGSLRLSIVCHVWQRGDNTRHHAHRADYSSTRS